MIRLFILWMLFLLFWNHKVFRNYIEITYKTLFYEMSEKNRFIREKMKTNKGWIP